MHMWYYFGTLHEKVLFSWLNPDNEAQTFAVCLMALAFAILHELMKYVRQVYFWDDAIRQKSGFSMLFDGKWLVNNLLYVVQMFLSYSLMLVCMYFNVWLVLSVCLGMGIGRLLFGIVPASGSVNVAVTGEENKGQTEEGCNC